MKWDEDHEPELAVKLKPRQQHVTSVLKEKRIHLKQESSCYYYICFSN